MRKIQKSVKERHIKRKAQEAQVTTIVHSETRGLEDVDTCVTWDCEHTESEKRFCGYEKVMLNKS